MIFLQYYGTQQTVFIASWSSFNNLLARYKLSWKSFKINGNNWATWEVTESQTLRCRLNDFTSLSAGVPQPCTDGERAWASIFKEKIRMFAKIFRFSNISIIKWTKSEEKSEYGGRWLWFTWIRPSPVGIRPLSKFRGDAPVKKHYLEIPMIHYLASVKKYNITVLVLLGFQVTTREFQNAHLWGLS